MAAYKTTVEVEQEVREVCARVLPVLSQTPGVNMMALQSIMMGMLFEVEGLSNEAKAEAYKLFAEAFVGAMETTGIIQRVEAAGEV